MTSLAKTHTQSLGKKLGHLTTILFISLIANQTVSAAENPRALHIFGLDTIAGYGTVIRSSQTIPEEKVYIFIEDPTGKKKLFEAKSDTNGVATLHLSEKETILAGTYLIAGQTRNGLIGSVQKFIVYPDSVSEMQSLVKLSQSTVAPGQKTDMTVVLRDRYGNAIKNHEVRALSSRNSDTVKINTSGVSNKNGVVELQIHPGKAGKSTFTVYDITSEVTLEKRPVLTIVETKKYEKFTEEGMGGDSELDQMIRLLADDGFGGLGGNIDAFEFEEIAESILANEPATFTLSAYDNEDNIATKYLGTVHFEIEDEKQQEYGTLPEDYTYTEEDLGQHIFSLGITFQKEGVYKVLAINSENEAITGEAVIVVKGSKDSSGSTGEPIIMQTPLPGTYGINIQTISGNTKPNSTVKIFNNNEEIGEADVNKNGKFTFSTKSLEDGIHSFTVALINSSGSILGTSDKIAITIDTSPAEVESIEFNPTEADPTAPIEVVIVSEPKLTKITIGFLGTNHELIVDPLKINAYRGVIAAPNAPGEYTVDIFLTDQLGNEVSYEKQGKLVVKSSGIPTEVTNITTFPGNGQVNLVWNPAQDNHGIKHYKIYFGTDPTSLTNIVDTFDNATTWYIPNLQNETEYYFGIVGVDTDGNEGKPGLVATAKPVGSTNIADQNDPRRYVQVLLMVITGQEVAWLIPLSIGIAHLFSKKKRASK